jgi:hypothetical protein
VALEIQLLDEVLVVVVVAHMRVRQVVAAAAAAELRMLGQQD